MVVIDEAEAEVLVEAEVEFEFVLVVVDDDISYFSLLRLIFLHLHESRRRWRNDWIVSARRK